MKRTVIVGVVLLVLLSSAVALAAIPSADGTIHGCREAKTGVLRVIDAEAGQTCTTKERPLTWSQTGPPGPPGPAGPVGPAGPQGLPGQNGVSGYEVVTTTADIPPGYASKVFPPFSLIANCPQGKRPTGGGATPARPDTGPNNEGSWIPQINGPNMSGPNALGWQAQFYNVGAPPTSEVQVQVWAICVAV
jgi:hypothetical protein